MHEIKKKYLLLSSVNTSVPYPGKSVYFLFKSKYIYLRLLLNITIIKYTSKKRP